LFSGVRILAGGQQRLVTLGITYGEEALAGAIEALDFPEERRNRALVLEVVRADNRRRWPGAPGRVDHRLRKPSRNHHVPLVQVRVNNTEP